MLTTALYGSSQLRQRFYLVSILEALNLQPTFPTPTHFIRIPSGYESAHYVALNTLNLFNHQTIRYAVPPKSNEALPSAITVREAIEDLPAITAHLDGSMPGGA